MERETTPLGQADTLLLLGFYVEERRWWGGGLGARERRRTDREVMGKMTLTPGTWRQVAEEEDSNVRKEQLWFGVSLGEQA